MQSERRLYWDSVVFIDLIQETAGRIQKIRPVFDSAKHGDLLIVTSAITMIEVVKLKELGLLDADAEERVAAFFENDYISIRNVDRFVAESARPLVREFNLKPVDATHVATALLMKVDALQTFDERHLLPLNGKIRGLTIERPGDS